MSLGVDAVVSGEAERAMTGTFIIMDRKYFYVANILVWNFM